MNLLDDLNVVAMARGSYGYGKWDAPYWFIGPEQGLSENKEKNNEEIARCLLQRAECWRELGGFELNDCREFHCCIGEMKWHCVVPVRPQTTWQALIVLLMAYLDEPDDLRSRRNYQRDLLGRQDGETCVIELSGLAAPNMREALDTSRFLPERIAVICERLRQHQPKLVLMYGINQKTKNFWNKIAKCYAGREFPSVMFEDFPNTYVLRQAITTLVCTPHPTSRPKPPHQYWNKLGTRLGMMST
jgi:hypothetical protein